MGKDSGWKQKLSSIFDLIGEILAVIYMLVFVLLLIDAQWPFLRNVAWLYDTFKVIWSYGGFVIAAIVGLEAMSKRNIIFFLVFVLMVVLCFIFLCFPETYANLIGFVS